MVVDSFRFLPRSFRPLYESPSPPPGETADPVWAPVDKRLSELTVTLLSSAGLYVEGSQEPFDLETERANPTWGDPSWRPIPASGGRLRVSHLHISADDIEADPEIALPRARLAELAAFGMVAGSAETHVSVMGFQDRSLREWLGATASEILALGPEAMVLAPA